MDTHAFMWFVNGDSRLGANARQEIENQDNISYLSIGSLWEIAIKINIGKLKLSYPYVTVIQQIEENGIELLPIKFLHTQQLINLPLHHRDPFDRLIIAQAMAEDMMIISKDENFNYYPVEIVW
jgi:PIN domain nuclease of toxin-antitoxin system